MVPILDLKTGQWETVFASDVSSSLSTYTSKQYDARGKWGFAVD